MEFRLVEWTQSYTAKNGVLPSHPQTKEKAIEFSKSRGGFKASKGWYEKFMNRHFGEMKSQIKFKAQKEEEKPEFDKQTEQLGKSFEMNSRPEKRTPLQAKSPGDFDNHSAHKENIAYSEKGSLLAKKFSLDGPEIPYEFDSQYFSICKMEYEQSYLKSRSPKNK